MNKKWIEQKVRMNKQKVNRANSDYEMSRAKSESE